MILKGSQRSGGQQLANHLLKTENEHVEVFELRGFASDNLKDALHEAYAVSRGTRCKQFMFSLSLNPPETAKVSDRDFRAAIDATERKLGLEGQPRAIVFHEKEGRRHAHCVWSRIDTETMTAINLPHYKLKLRDLSRELFVKHGWKMPVGLVDSRERDPLNFSLAEWQQAKRAGHDPKKLKAIFQECWAISDSRAAFANALDERGYWLARGDRRGFVAVDFQGEVYAIAKYVGQRTTDVRAKLGDPQTLPSLAETKELIASRMTARIKSYIAESRAAFRKDAAVLALKKAELTQRHKQQRERLRQRHNTRWTAENNRRAARLRRGLRGIWDRLTGTYRHLRRENERETLLAFRRDEAEKHKLIVRQLDQRQVLQKRIKGRRIRQAKALMQLHRDVRHYMRMTTQEPARPRTTFNKASRRKEWQGDPAKERRHGRGRRRKRDFKPDS